MTLGWKRGASWYIRNKQIVFYVKHLGRLSTQQSHNALGSESTQGIPHCKTANTYTTNLQQATCNTTTTIVQQPAAQSAFAKQRTNRVASALDAAATVAVVLGISVKHDKWNMPWQVPPVYSKIERGTKKLAAGTNPKYLFVEFLSPNFPGVTLKLRSVR